jgi:hypothetical protein
MVERKDVEAALAARHELGRAYEPEIVDSMLEKIERRLAERRPGTRPHREGSVTPLALGSIGCGVGATAISTGHPGIGGVLVAIIAWIAIAVVNVAYAWWRN